MGLPPIHASVILILTANAISDHDRDELLFLHISTRVSVRPPAINMKSLFWSVKLEQLALNWAQKCSWVRPDPSVPAERPLIFLGINVAVISIEIYGEFVEVPPSPSFFYALWVSNSHNFDTVMNICKFGYCDNYKQIIWSEWDSMGCERAFCYDELKRHVLVCLYSSSSNRTGVRPYEFLDYDEYPLMEYKDIMIPLKRQPEMETSRSREVSLYAPLILFCLTTTLMMLINV